MHNFLNNNIRDAQPLEGEQDDSGAQVRSDDGRRGRSSRVRRSNSACKNMLQSMQVQKITFSSFFLFYGEFSFFLLWLVLFLLSWLVVPSIVACRSYYSDLPFLLY